jgi:hypothetical protein
LVMKKKLFKKMRISKLGGGSITTNLSCNWFIHSVQKNSKKLYINHNVAINNRIQIQMI